MNRIKNLYGSPKTSCTAVCITNFVIFIIIYIVFKKNISLKTIFNYYSSDFSNIAGVMGGFLFAALGIIGATNNSITERLIKTNNLKLVYKIFINSIVFFTLTVCIYFTKPLLIFDVNNVATFSNFKYFLLEILYFFGLYSFFNALSLFLFSLYILKKILTNN